MRSHWTALVLLLLIVPLTVSCRKIGSEPPPKGPLPVEKVAFDNAISLQYGDLVAVTTQTQGNDYVLWFVKPDKSIVAIGVDSGHATLAGLVLNIPRR
jgi:hypothetical protein